MAVLVVSSEMVSLPSDISIVGKVWRRQLLREKFMGEVWRR